MFKKTVVVSSIAHLALTIVIYIVLAYQLSVNDELMLVLANTDFLATSLRLSMYVVPGLFLLGGLFGLVFDTKPLLVFMGLLMLASSIFMLDIAYDNGFMKFISILALIFSVTYIVGTLLSSKK